MAEMPAPYQPAPLRHLPLQSENRHDPYDDPTRKTPDDTEDEKEIDRKKKLIATALKQFRAAEIFEGPQRRRELEDLQFDRALPEDQWPLHILKARSAGVGPDGVTLLPDLPCLTIPKLDQPVQQVIDEARRARLGVQIKPKGSGATSDGAWVRQGLYRNMEMRCRANQARLWALDRAAKCGRGVYRILKQYVSKKSFDQEIVIERVLNQHSVYLDPFSQKLDWSDGEFAFLTYDMPEEQFERMYPKAKTNYTSEEFTAIGDRAKGWMTTGQEDGARTYRVAEYFYIEHSEKTLIHTPAGDFYVDELPLDMQAWAKLNTPKTRPVDDRIVKWVVMTADEVLDEETWDGEWIPVIPVIGKEYNVNGDRCWKGVISNSKDSQRMFNYTSSQAMVASGLLSRAPWLLAAGQDEGFQKMWNDPNPYKYLIYQPTTFEGLLIPPPQRNFGAVDLSSFAQLRADADMDIQATTARFNASLGRQSAGDRSGKLANALIQQGESATSTYLENLAQISMAHEARVVLDLFKHVFDTPGRIERVLGEEDTDEQTVMLNAPFVHGPDGQPIPVPQDPQQAQGLLQRVKQFVRPGQKKQKKQGDVKHYDLKTGEYDVVIDIGRSFATQRDETNSMISDLIQADPQIATRIADILVSGLNTPFAKKLEERLKPADVQDDDQAGPTPEQVAEMGKQHEALMQKVGELQHALESKQAEAQAKAQADIEKAHIAANADIERAKIQAAAAGIVAAAKLDSAEAIRLIEIEADRAGLDTQQRAAFIDQHLTQLHERAQADQEHVHRVIEARLAPPPPTEGASA